MSVGSAVIIWVSFVLPAVLVTLRWRGAGWASALADCAVWLVVLLMQAVVLQTIGLRHP